MNENKNRIGRLKISQVVIESVNYESLVNILKDFIVVRCEFFYATQELEYTAISKYFEAIGMGCIPPEYTFTISKVGKEHIIKDVKKIK